MTIRTPNSVLLLIEFAKSNTTPDTRDSDHRSTRTDSRFKVRPTGEKDAAFEWLEKAYAAHDHQIVRLKEELGYDNLRSDPRYADLLRRVGLPQ